MTVFQHVFDDINIVLAPFNVSGDHWELLAFYPSVRNIVYVNPLGEKPTRIKAILNAWNAITKWHPNKVPQGTWKVTLRPHTRQQDGHSCGVLVMEFADLLLAGKDLMIENTVNNLRRQQAQRLLGNMELNAVTKCCRYCGSQDTGTREWASIICT
ncbi:hypothetical protein NP493_867g01010 [Ridgeia piscesae]|uniref:Ubiquitin-like protease family profile domain-containing protein n=1 Tax=Ridgeia piscesae TaxID=27915 RepID=A0AAD9KLT6_RIDPI|nr:hypothetical protein NP493_867g01010 [Ridgeia piscesae]